MTSSGGRKVGKHSLHEIYDIKTNPIDYNFRIPDYFYSVSKTPNGIMNWIARVAMQLHVCPVTLSRDNGLKEIQRIGFVRYTTTGKVFSNKMFPEN